MRIIEQDILDEPGVSRGLIRKAPRQLEQEDLVEYVGNVGCSMRNITLEDTYKIYLLKATYETPAVKLCRGVLSEAAFVEMDAALEPTRNLKDMDYSKSTACGDTLYEAITRSTGLPRLAERWTDLDYGSAANCYTGNPDSRTMIDRRHSIHKELVDVCRTGNTEDIRKATSDHHIKTTKRRLEEQGILEDHFKFFIDAIGGWA